MDIHLQREPGEPPVYLQIAAQIRRRVECGELSPGERLPTIRALAGELGVNRDTVSLAYEALAADGLVEARVGSGTFVRRVEPRRSRAAAAASPRFTPLVDRLLDHERARVTYPDATDAIAMHALVPDPALFPVEAFRRAIGRVLGEEGRELLGYGGPQGHLGLREEIASRLRSSGITVGADAVVCTQGASQGIALALRLFAEPGDAVAVEEPTYQNVLATLHALGLRPVPVPMGSEGADLDVLDRVLSQREVKLFYTIPTFHNPMGTSTSLAHREALLELAHRHGKPVVEDAFEMDLRFTGRAVAPLAGLDDSGLVVQLLSFSKSLFPGVRAGAIVARGPAVDAVLALRHASDLGGALPMQAALADFLRSGAYERHLQGLRRRLRSRAAVLTAALEGLPSGSRFTRPEGGYQLWCELPEGIDSREVFEDASRRGLLFAPGAQFHHDGRPSRGLRLAYALADEEALRRGVAILDEVTRARLERPRPPRRDRVVHM